MESVGEAGVLVADWNDVVDAELANLASSRFGEASMSIGWAVCTGANVTHPNGSNKSGSVGRISLFKTLILC